MILSRSPQCRAFSRAVMDEKSLSPLFPVGGGGGAVVTNDWCINYIMHQSFVTPVPPPLRGWAGDSGDSMRSNDLLFPRSDR